MAYKKVGGFNNGTTPAIDEDALDQMESGIDLNSKYVSVTASTDGDYLVDLSDYFELTDGAVLKVAFPSATDSGDNARLSIDGGSNYKNIKDENGNQLLGSDIEDSNIELYYDGTDFILIGNIQGVVKAYRDSGNTAIANATYVAITLDSSATIDSNLYAISSGRITVKKSGYYLITAIGNIINLTDGKAIIVEIYDHTNTTTLAQTSQFIGAATAIVRDTVATMQYIAAGTEISLRLLQNSGGSLDSDDRIDYSQLCIAKLK